ncbi:MAG: hypothetical protein JO000_25910 [Alphaproteobacteria bacterium]|nr:hypothetical protein [Alphaproteobacteria bacterium]
MKRILLTTVILLGATFAARADNTTWTDLTGQNRGDYALHQDGEYCNYQVGPDLNGHPTPPAYKQCMRSRGWRLAAVTWEPWTWRHNHGWHHGYGYGDRYRYGSYTGRADDR